MRRIMDLLSLKEHLARTLLIHYRWDVDKVIVVLVEKGKDKLYAEAGVTVSEHDNLSSELPSMVMCIICIEEVSATEVTTMDCGHCFCNNCEYCSMHFLLFPNPCIIWVNFLSFKFNLTKTKLFVSWGWPRRYQIICLYTGKYIYVCHFFSPYFRNRRAIEP